MIRQRIVLATAAGLASTLLLAACGSSTDNASSTSPGSAATAGSDPAMSAPADSGDPGTGDMAMATTTMLMAKDMGGGMGSMVTDDKGMALYRSDADQADPPMSMCTGECAKTWMPVMAQGDVEMMGVEKSLVGSVDRSDGMKQLTLGGWPLYRYMGDTKAGQMNGQAKDDKWFAVTPSGKKSTMEGMAGMTG
ncbi:hypothetical protein ACF09G_03775 [Streptomyces albogriseolus]|uniref:Lipoprotein n=2 Tax=unclassified Streptomyces TaxID=2593676 RepID=V9Z4C0_9ACTN|nr:MULTISPECIES: lipoprotein [unclassified Streptomyces]AHE38890.1 Lipoprotein [Streptomyces sp. FR1]AHE39372.1 Lipoprotein [Streptomyces sp. F2]